MPITKAVVWGHKLHTHTHSYIHEGFYRAFQHLGFETSWYDDTDDVSGVDWSNTIVLTEGQVDGRLPIRRDCHYVLHNCDRGRYETVADRSLALQVYTHDVVAADAERIAPHTFYSRGCLIQPWATDLLPHEVDLAWASAPRRRRVTWVGTIGGGPFGNVNEIEPFRRACREHGVRFIQLTRVTRPAHIAVIQDSWVAPAIQGAWQLEHGYIACRIFKNISYGQMGLTNSATVQALFEDRLLFHTDPFALFVEGQKFMSRRAECLARTRELVEAVRERHTYVNRVRTILSVLPGGA